MELSYRENFALLILMIKEGGKDSKQAEEKLLSFARVMDLVSTAVDQENDKKD